MSLAFKFPPFVSKLRLSRKIAILLVFPLAIQLLLFWSLSGLFETTQKLEALEAQQTELIEGLDLMLLDRADAWGGLLGQALFNVPFTQTMDADTYKANIQKDFASVRQSENANPHIMELLNEIESTYGEEYQVLKSLESIPEDSPMFAPMNKLKMVRPALHRLGKRSASIQRQIEREISKAAVRRSTQRTALEQARTQLLAGIVVNLLVAAATIFIFIRRLNERLLKIARNASLVPQIEPLPYIVPGDDELAFLDSVLHSAHRDLQDAKRDRQALTAMIAHDLRSPLMSVQLVIDSLLKSEAVKESESILKKTESLNLNMKRVNSLLEDLLTVEKLESGQLEIHLDAVPLKTLVQEVFTLVEGQAKGKSLELVNDVQEFELVADRGRLSQVLVNFLTNAIKFSPDGGTIRVSSARKKGEITVSVQDNGPGIALDEQFHLFEKFYRTPSGKQHKGFGLGLAICKMLIAQHGGTVGVISKAGRGATFWFTLPDDGAYA